MKLGAGDEKAEIRPGEMEHLVNASAHIQLDPADATLDLLDGNPVVATDEVPRKPVALLRQLQSDRGPEIREIRPLVLREQGRARDAEPRRFQASLLLGLGERHAGEHPPAQGTEIPKGACREEQTGPARQPSAT